MKKVASILVLVFAFTLTTQAQKKRKDNRPQLSVEQQTELMTKQMVLTLDLSEKQQNQIMPLIKAQVASKKSMMEKKKAMQEANTKPTSDEIFAMKSNVLDNRIAMKRKMKDILNPEQFEGFEKMAKEKMMRNKKMMMKKGMEKGMERGMQRGKKAKEGPRGNE
jgi:hypothetical protein